MNEDDLQYNSSLVQVHQPSAVYGTGEEHVNMDEVIIDEQDEEYLTS